MIQDKGGRAAIDWDEVLRMGNSFHDQVVDAYFKPNRAERRAAFGQIGRDLNQTVAPAKGWKWLAGAALTGSRKSASKEVGLMLVGLEMSALSACLAAEDRATMQFELAKFGFALAAYRADHGSYPAKLAELAPKYVPEIPKDLFNDTDLHYKPESKGYLLYSVGPNGKDDGGKGIFDCKEGEGWDDISIRAGK
jgi:hypothetical protein